MERERRMKTCYMNDYSHVIRTLHHSKLEKVLCGHGVYNITVGKKSIWTLKLLLKMTECHCIE